MSTSSLQRLVNDYLADCRARGLSPKTLKDAYGYPLHQVLLPWCERRGITEPRELDQRTLNQLTSDLLELGGRRGKLSRFTVDTYVRNVNLFLGWCRQFDLCTGTDLLAASGTTSIFDLHMARDLSRATLVARQIHTIDFSTATVFDIDVNVSWDGTANLIGQSSTTTIKNPREIIVAAEVGWTRAAQATGTVSHGSTNYIRSPSNNAEVQFLLSGEIDITRTG